MLFRSYFSGPYGFVCAAPRPLPFRKWRGELGFFEVPEREAEGMLARSGPAPAGQGGLFA